MVEGGNPSENALNVYRAEPVATTGVGTTKLLKALGYERSDQGELRAYRDDILAIAAKARRIFRLNRPGSNNINLIGMAVDAEAYNLCEPADSSIFAGGRGAGFRQAFESCVGEAFERLSLQAWKSHLERMNEGAPNPAALDPTSRCMTGVSLKDNQPVAAAFEQVFRLPPHALSALPLASSVGCAAAWDPSVAAERALLELVERDAIASWWYADQAGYELENARCDLAKLFHQEPEADRWCLSLDTDLPVHIIVACSSGRCGQPGVVIGAAADFDRTNALKRAATELFQMEHAAMISIRKARESLPLNESDSVWIDRLCRLRVDRFPILRRSRTRPEQQNEKPGAMSALLGAIPGDVAAFDISLPGYTLSAVRVIAPGLQSMDLDKNTARLGNNLDESDLSERAFRQKLRPI